MNLYQMAVSLRSTLKYMYIELNPEDSGQHVRLVRLELGQLTYFERETVDPGNDTKPKKIASSHFFLTGYCRKL